MKNKILYRLAHESLNDYRILTVEVLFFDDVFDRVSNVVFRCQGHPVDDIRGKYYSTQVGGIDNYVARIGNFLNRLLKHADVSNLNNVDAFNLLGFLNKQRAKQCVYDDRISKFVALDELAPKEWFQFGAVSPTGIYMSCVAPDKDQAVKTLTKQLGAYKESWLQYWITSGRPTKMFDQGRFDIYTIEDAMYFGR